MLCHQQKELLTVQAACGAIIQAPTLIGCEFLKSGYDAAAFPCGSRRSPVFWTAPQQVRPRLWLSPTVPASLRDVQFTDFATQNRAPAGFSPRRAAIWLRG